MTEQKKEGSSLHPRWVWKKYKERPKSLEDLDDWRDKEEAKWLTSVSLPGCIPCTFERWCDMKEALFESEMSLESAQEACRAATRLTAEDFNTWVGNVPY